MRVLIFPRKESPRRRVPLNRNQHGHGVLLRRKRLFRLIADAEDIDTCPRYATQGVHHVSPEAAIRRVPFLSQVVRPNGTEEFSNQLLGTPCLTHGGQYCCCLWDLQSCLQLASSRTAYRLIHLGRRWPRSWSCWLSLSVFCFSIPLNRGRLSQ